MVSKSLAAFVFMFVAVLEADCADTKCGLNEEYNDCGSFCPAVCGQEPKFCIQICNSGCFCKKGFIRNAGGICITEKQCEQQRNKICGLNEEYNECGPSCPAVCGQEPKFCIQACSSGCFCKKGFIKNAEGICITEKQCEQERNRKCGLNEEYNECGSFCPAICGQEQRICIAACKSGCFCRKGFIRNAKGACIREEQCKEQINRKCGLNEEYNECGSFCPAVCGQEQGICISACKSGCFCRKGFIRNSKGACIREEQCKEQINRKCGLNEEYNECGSFCPAVCGQEQEFCIDACKSGCFCRKGFIRNSKEVCIKEEQCKEQINRKCKLNEEYNECGSFCPAVCGQEQEICIDACKSGCFCKKGFIRNVKGACIREEQCKEEISYQKN